MLHKVLGGVLNGNGSLFGSLGTSSGLPCLIYFHVKKFETQFFELTFHFKPSLTLLRITNPVSIHGILFVPFFKFQSSAGLFVQGATERGSLTVAMATVSLLAGCVTLRMTVQMEVTRTTLTAMPTTPARLTPDPVETAQAAPNTLTDVIYGQIVAMLPMSCAKVGRGQAELFRE